MNCDLPETVELGGRERAVRWDYRAILDILIALSDPELSEREKQYAALRIFYPELETIPRRDMKEALEACYRFIDGGETAEDGQRHRRMVDWEQDFGLIAPPVNRVLGTEIRTPGKPLHWWTFLGAFYEIGDCLFAQVIRVRDRQASGKKLDSVDREFYRKNKKLVDLRRRYTETDDKTLKGWL